MIIMGYQSELFSPPSPCVRLAAAASGVEGRGGPESPSVCVPRSSQTVAKNSQVGRPDLSGSDGGRRQGGSIRGGRVGDSYYWELAAFNTRVLEMHDESAPCSLTTLGTLLKLFLCF